MLAVRLHEHDVAPRLEPRELRREGRELERCRDTTEPVRWEPDRARDEAWAVAAERPREPDPQKTPIGAKTRRGSTDPGAAAVAAALATADEAAAGASEWAGGRARTRNSSMSEERVIVVAAEDAFGFDGEVSAHFGRCPFFLLAEANGTTHRRSYSSRATSPLARPGPLTDSLL